MGVLDKFLNAMKMNDDDGLEDDEYFDEEYDEEYEEEERPKKRILSTKYKEDEDDYARSASRTEAPASEEARSQTSGAARQAKPRVPRSTSKISPMRSSGSKRGSGMEVCVIRPKNMEDAREVTETLLDDCTVVLNMEGIDFELAQRIIDFACGSCYAIHGKLQKISNYIFIITPQSVDISGDFQEILNGAFDVPSFGTSF